MRTSVFVKAGIAQAEIPLWRKSRRVGAGRIVRLKDKDIWTVQRSQGTLSRYWAKHRVGHFDLRRAYSEQRRAKFEPTKLRSNALTRVVRANVSDCGVLELHKNRIVEILGLKFAPYALAVAKRVARTFLVSSHGCSSPLPVTLNRCDQFHRCNAERCPRPTPEVRIAWRAP